MKTIQKLQELDILNGNTGGGYCSKVGHISTLVSLGDQNT
jgi:hypothetical protein